MKALTNKRNLFIIVSLLLVIGFSLTNLISYQAAKKTVRNNIINTSLPLTRDNIYSEIQRDIMVPVHVASLMANDTFLKDWVIKGENNYLIIQKYLNEIKQKYNLFTSFYISVSSKNYYYYDGILKKISSKDKRDRWYQNFLDKNVPYELVVDKNQAANNALTIFINHRVYDYDSNLIGVTGVGLDLERITNLLSAYRVKYERDIYLTDKYGLIKAHHNKDLVDIANIRLMEGISEKADSILTVDHASDNYEYDKYGKHILLTKRFIPEINWFLLVEQNQNKAIEGIWFNFIRSTILGLLVSTAVVMIVIASINYYNKILEKLAITDELTGSYNRREFSRIYDKAVSWSKKTGDVFSVMLIDIDNFKQINDSLGHNTGDLVIKAVTRICNDSIRDNDLIARWGGDEFIMLIYGEIDTAQIIAERISLSMRADEELKQSVTNGKDVTLSIGIAEHTPEDTEETLTIRADRALYYAKEAGRNRIITEQALVLKA